MLARSALNVLLAALTLALSAGEPARAEAPVDPAVTLETLLMGQPAVLANTPLERALLSDAADGQLGQPLLDAALVASGAQNASEVRRDRARFDLLFNELRASGQVQGSIEQQARTIFEFMHRRILTGVYDSRASELTAALHSGNYNCASATILYVCLTDQFGLAAQGVELPGHMLTRIGGRSGRLYVETTCPSWFALSEGERIAALITPRQSGEASPAGQVSSTAAITTGPGGPRASAAAFLSGRGGERSLSPNQLVAVLYYNRAIDLLHADRFEDAARTNLKALLLDRDQQLARGNLLATINNWALSCSSAGQFSTAARMLSAGLTLSPKHPTLLTNRAHVCRAWASTLSEQGDYKEALDVLDDALAAAPHDPLLLQERERTYQAWSAAH